MIFNLGPNLFSLSEVTRGSAFILLNIVSYWCWYSMQQGLSRYVFVSFNLHDIFEPCNNTTHLYCYRGRKSCVSVFLNFEFLNCSFSQQIFIIFSRRGCLRHPFHHIRCCLSAPWFFLTREKGKFRYKNFPRCNKDSSGPQPKLIQVQFTTQLQVSKMLDQ